MSSNIFNFDISNTSKSVVNEYKIKNNRIFLPWVEKYRPSKLSDVILDNLTKQKMINFLEKEEVSNMIITGHPGTGKTSTILCLAKQIYKSNYNDDVIEYNASDNRGLETINNSIIYFCKKKSSSKKKLVILDEADNITKKAQNTLCNLMEMFKDTTKFALTCNEYFKLIEGIQTRCLIIRYNSLPNIFIKDRLKYICKEEKIKFTEDGLDAIIFISQGDIRQAINCLESTFFGFKKITYQNIYKICEVPSHIDIRNLIFLCRDSNLRNIIDKILKIKNEGYCNNDILLTIINVLKYIELEDDLRIELMNIASKIYINVNDGIDSKIQILSCICQFYNAFKKIDN